MQNALNTTHQLKTENNRALNDFCEQKLSVAVNYNAKNACPQKWELTPWGVICLPKHAQVENAALFFQLEHLVTRDKYPAETKQSGSLYISRRDK